MNGLNSDRGTVRISVSSMKIDCFMVKIDCSMVKPIPKLRGTRRRLPRPPPTSGIAAPIGATPPPCRGVGGVLQPTQPGGNPGVEILAVQQLGGRAGQLHQTAGAAHQHDLAGRLRLQRGEAKAFVQRRVQHKLAAGVRQGQFVGRQVRQQPHPLGQAGAAGDFQHGVGGLAGEADHRQLQFPPGWAGGPALQQPHGPVGPFSRRPTADVQHVRAAEAQFVAQRLHGPRVGRRGEALVQPVRNDADLAPCEGEAPHDVAHGMARDRDDPPRRPHARGSTSWRNRRGRPASWGGPTASCRARSPRWCATGAAAPRCPGRAANPRPSAPPRPARPVAPTAASGPRDSGSG